MSLYDRVEVEVDWRERHRLKAQAFAALPAGRVRRALTGEHAGERITALAQDARGNLTFLLTGERKVVVNPPVCVPDPLGPIVRRYTNRLTGEITESRFRFDLEAALLEIVAGLHTVTTVYADAADDDVYKSSTTYATAAG